MSADRLLAIDVGTQSVRAMVFDPEGIMNPGILLSDRHA